MVVTEAIYRRSSASLEQAIVSGAVERAFRENRARFVNKRPNPPDKPTAAWINPPQTKSMVQA